MNVPMSTARPSTTPILRLVTWEITWAPMYTPTAISAARLTVTVAVGEDLARPEGEVNRSTPSGPSHVQDLFAGGAHLVPAGVSGGDPRLPAQRGDGGSGDVGLGDRRRRHHDVGELLVVAVVGDG